MKRNLGLRLVIIAAILVLATAFFLPSLPGVKDSALGDILPKKYLSQGLDLQGGMYLTLGVGVDKAVENALVQAGEDVRGQARDKGIQITTPRQAGESRLEFTLPDGGKAGALEAAIREVYPTQAMNLTKQSLPDGGQRYLISFTPAEISRLEENALDTVLKTIRNRIDEFGVAEPDIRKIPGDNRIVVQLPGLDDPGRAIQIIGKTAHLEFHIEYDTSRLDMGMVERGILPQDALRLPVGEARSSERFIIVQRNAVMTGEDIADAYQSFDENQRPAVALSFSRRGAAVFERVTGENTHKRMAIVLDGTVHSAPVINDRISGGRASITGSFTIAEANDLALVLRAGSLPAPVTVLEERAVGPSLGKQSIEMGTNAALVGVIGVSIFMIVYYSLSGVIATAMVLLDILLILSGMALLGATLTLPGIAGIVLTLGMAVDANVLIFERIREELRAGQIPVKAVQLGFSRATITIFDSNLTTVIAAIILYQFGTGPVRGFAVTLTLGLIVSMFTAIIVSRAIFDLWITNKSTKISV